MVQIDESQLSKKALARLEERLQPLRKQLEVHPLYKAIQSVDDLRFFMEHHVFAVWDFMSLLKALQVNLTCIDVPWVPRGPRTSRRLINEIVLGEESDYVGGQFISHLELYIESMDAAGANSSHLKSLLSIVQTLGPQPSAVEMKKALNEAKVPEAAAAFVSRTFDFVRSGSLPTIAAAFAFGREDLIPLMFTSLLKDMNRGLGGILDTFIVYLERHIEVDGEDHGPMSLLMMSEICGGDDDKRWDEAIETAYNALKARVDLWDGVVAALKEHKAKAG